MEAIVWKLGVLLVGYSSTMMFSSYVLKKLVLAKKKDINNDGFEDDEDQKIIDEGYIIGKCENVIILTLILVNALTALAIVFTAKNIVRKDDIQQNPQFYLLGTLLNFTISLVLGVLLKSALEVDLDSVIGLFYNP